MLIIIIFQGFIPTDCMMASVIQGDIIDAKKSDGMWVGFHCKMHGKVAQTNSC